MRRLAATALVAAFVVTGCASQGPAFTASTPPPATPAAAATAAPAPTAPPTATPVPATPAPATPAPATPAPTAPPTATPVPATPAAATSSPGLGFVPGTTSAPRLIAMTVDDKLTFFPNVVTVAQGETVRFRLKNLGKAEHEFMLGPVDAAFADTEGTAEVAGILAGETKELIFTFDGAGPYAFACHEPGHFEAGMLGYVVVVGPDVPAVGTKANPRLIGLWMNDKLTFVPSEITVASGETVTFLISNEQKALHEFAVGPADMVDADKIDGKLVLEADEIEGHHVKTLTYTFDGPGPYAFACHEPGHFEAGMRGTVEIR